MKPNGKRRKVESETTGVLQSQMVISSEKAGLSSWCTRCSDADNAFERLATSQCTKFENQTFELFQLLLSGVHLTLDLGVLHKGIDGIQLSLTTPQEVHFPAKSSFCITALVHFASSKPSQEIHCED